MEFNSIPAVFKFNFLECFLRAGIFHKFPNFFDIGFFVFPFRNLVIRLPERKTNST